MRQTEQVRMVAWVVMDALSLTASAATAEEVRLAKKGKANSNSQP